MKPNRLLRNLRKRGWTAAAAGLICGLLGAAMVGGSAASAASPGAASIQTNGAGQGNDVQSDIAAEKTLSSLASTCRPESVKQISMGQGDQTYIPLFGTRKEDKKAIEQACGILKAFAAKGVSAPAADMAGDMSFFLTEMDFTFTDGANKSVYISAKDKLAVREGHREIVLSDPAAFKTFLGLQVQPDNTFMEQHTLSFGEWLRIKGNNDLRESGQVLIFLTTDSGSNSPITSAEGVHYPSRSSLLLYKGTSKFGRYDFSFRMPAYGEAFDGSLKPVLPGGNAITMSLEWLITSTGIKLMPAKQVFLSVNGLPADDERFTPIMSEGHTLLPVRSMASLTGESIAWDTKTRSVLIRTSPAAVAGPAADGSAQLWIDGKRAAADLQPLIRNQSAYVPIRAVTAAFGLPVVWDSGSRSVNVTVEPSLSKVN